MMDEMYGISVGMMIIGSVAALAVLTLIVLAAAWLARDLGSASGKKPGAMKDTRTASYKANVTGSGPPGLAVSGTSPPLGPAAGARWPGAGCGHGPRQREGKE